MDGSLHRLGEVLQRFEEELTRQGRFLLSQQVTDILEDNTHGNMTALTIDPLKYLEKLPEFNGNMNDLQTFVDLIDRIHPLLGTYNQFSQQVFSDIIKSKFKGKAKEAVEINGHVTAWNDIKAILFNNFSDRKSVDELFNELRGQNFRTNSIEFYNDIKYILRRLNTKTRQEMSDAVTEDEIEQTLNLNIKAALQTFKSKIPEPMRSVLYCRDPKTLEEAMNILHEAKYSYFSPYNPKIVPNYTQNNNHRKPNSNNNSNYERSGRTQTQSSPNNWVQTRTRTTPHPQNNWEQTQNSRTPRTQNYWGRAQTGHVQQHQNQFSQNQPNIQPNNYRYINNNSQQLPEPMDINMNENVQGQLNQQSEENFCPTASILTYHI